MAMKLLKYGIGIFMPEAPEGFDPSGLLGVAPKTIEIPAGEDAGLIVLEAPPARATLRIAMGAGSRARFVEMAHAPRELRVELSLGAGAQAEYLSAAGDGAYESVRREARLAEGARLSWIDACTSPEFSRTAFVTSLEGEGAEVSSLSLVIGSGRQRYDAWHEIRHLAPRTVSDLKVRTLLKDDAKAIVRGLVRVEKDAPGCTGFQREETLLLSEYAEIDAVPNLEIENQDVKSGHAASIGRLDEEKLFYLMSRGLDRAAAERVLIDAFIEPFLSAVSDEALRASLSETIAAKLS